MELAKSRTLKEIVRAYPALLLAVAAAGALFFVRGNYLTYDDISMLAIADPRQRGAVAMLDRMPNGFWRPINCLMFWALQWSVGLRPLWYAGAAILLHAGAVAALYRTMRMAFGIAASGALLAAGWFAASPALFFNWAQLANSCDSACALALILLLGWGFGPDEQDRTKALRSFLLFLIALAAKETALAYAAVAATFAWRVRSKSARNHAIAVGCAAFYYLAYLAWELGRSTSYAAEGRVVFHPATALRQVADHAISVVFPNLHVLAAPYDMEPSHGFLWIVRGAVLAGLGWLAFRLFRSGSPMQCAAYAGFVASIAPVALLADPPQARYLYLPSAFAALLAASAGRRWIFPCLLAFAAAGWMSPSISRFQEDARRLGEFASVLLSVERPLPPGASIAVHGLPIRGPAEQRWTYGQLLVWQLAPDKRLQLVLDPMTAWCAATFRIDGDGVTASTRGGDAP